MKSVTQKIRIFFYGIFIATFLAFFTGQSQTNFTRDDNFDIQGMHQLYVSSDPNNFNPVIYTSSDFPHFKLHIRKKGLDLFDTGPWYATQFKVFIDGNTVQDWTTASEITITYNFPDPPNGISANHTLGIQVDYVDLAGDPLPTKSGDALFTVFAKPRVYKDNDNNAFVQLKNEDAAAKIPILMVEGFDPTNEKFPENYYNLTWDLVHTDLYPNNYEAFILNFADGGRDLRLNANVLLKALEKVHEICPNYKIAVAGLSMGGPITRYALAKKESQSETHFVGLFLSYDSPQGKINSVHVSPNMQDWIYTLDPNDGAAGVMQANLQSVAAKQMLGYNTYDREHILHDAFYDELNALNGDGYPHESYNVAVSNGNFNATWGYAQVGRHLMTLKINDQLINQVPATQLDCGTGSMITDITMRRYGDIFSSPFLSIYYQLAIEFNPAYTPTYSALDLVGANVSPLTGDIISFERSKFDDYVVQTNPLQHHELSTLTRSKIVEWLDRDITIDVSYNLLDGGSTAPDVYQVDLLGGAVTVPNKIVTVNGQQVTYYFSRWEDGNTDNPRVFYTSPHTATMETFLPQSVNLVLPANNATNVHLQPTLRWSSVPGAQTYEVQVDIQNPPDAPYAYQIENASGTSIQTSGLTYSTTYRWWVRAKNAYGNGPWSSVRTFTTSIAPPSMPSNFHISPTSTGCDIEPPEGPEFWGGEESFLGGEQTESGGGGGCSQTKLTWNPLPGSGNSIEIRRGTSPGSLFSYATISYSSTCFTDGPCFGQIPTYYYQIYATNDGGNSPMTAILCNGASKAGAENNLQTNITNGFNLEQNAPNPFNPVTNIKYHLPNDSYVSLKVYNTLGKEVATLVNNNQSAGYKSITFNAEDLPSGVYYYHLLAKGISSSASDMYSDIKKMVLLQ